MARTPIYAAGGIVVRGGRRRPLIAVVQRSKDEAWVLPRGKLKRDEDPVVGARREVVEETGHRVHVHEFVGAITYRARGRPKVVQFWRMQAYERPSRDVMKDIVAVEWLPLSAAVRRLSYPLEKLFLQFAGRRALKRRKRAGKKKKKKTHARRKTNVAAIRKRKPAQPRRKTRARKTGARKTSTQKPRAHKTRKPQRTTPRARTTKSRGPVRRATVQRHKPRRRAPTRVAAAKQSTPTKFSTPVQAAAVAAYSPASIQTAAPMQHVAPIESIAAAQSDAAPQRPTMLERVLCRLSR